MSVWLLIQLAVPVTLIAVAVGGRVAHSRRATHIAARQAAVAHLAVSPRDTPPTGLVPAAGELVIGSVVVGADYIRQIVSSFRGLIGGEVRSYSPVVEQARAESMLRMLEAAVAGGARAVVNVRFETVRISRQASEFVAYGTRIS